MPHGAIQDWLKSEARSEAWGSVLFALSCALMGGVVLALSFVALLLPAWVLVAMVTQAASGEGVAPGSGPAVWACVLAGAGLIVLFCVNAQVGRSEAQAARRREARWQLGQTRGSMPALTSLMAYPGYTSGGFGSWVLVGPRLTHLAWAHLGRAWRLGGMDLAAGERVLRILLAKGKRMALGDLIIHADLDDPAGLLLVFRELPGMIFLSEPPPGLTLSEEYRGALDPISGPLPVLRSLEAEDNRASAIVRSLSARLGLEPTSGESGAKPEASRSLRLPGQPWEAKLPDAAGQSDERPADPRWIWERHRGSGGRS